jgi:hypothetical protein
MPGLASNGCAPRESDVPAADFVISNLGVTFGPWDPVTNTAGDFVFLVRERKLFLEFGAVVSAEGGGTKELPTFEYRLRRDALVRAIADGRVIRAVFQEETGDYEFLMESTQDPSFQVGYDHVLNPTVSLGDIVRAGDVLGNPGTWSAQLGRFEIMINNTETGLSYCPFSFFDPAFKGQYQQGVSVFIADWETFKGDPDIYDEENHVCPGCRYESMVTY